MLERDVAKRHARNWAIFCTKFAFRRFPLPVSPEIVIWLRVSAMKPTFLELRYLYGGVAHYRPGETLGPRRLPDYELVYMLEGTATYCANGKEYAAPPGTLLLPRPGFNEEFHWDLQRPTRHGYLHFDIARLPSDWPNPNWWPVAIENPSSVVSALVHRIIRHVSIPAGPPMRVPNRRVTRLLETLISEMVLDATEEDRSEPEWERPEPVKRAIHRMRQAINQRPPATLTLNDLARAAGVTPHHLIRLFRSSLGLAPMETLRLMRLQLALALLSHTTLQIGAIADRCGFGNVFHFSRRFSAHFGRPPSALRQALREGKPAPKSPLPPDVLPRVYW